MKKDTSRSTSGKSERINPKHAKFIIRAPRGLKSLYFVCALGCVLMLGVCTYSVVVNIRVLGEVLFLILFAVYLLAYLLAVITEKIEVRDGILKIKYLFFIKKEYPIKRITGWYKNSLLGGRTPISYTYIGVYIDGKKLILPMQPESRWKDIDSWETFLKSLKRKHEHISEVEFWPFKI